MTILKKNIQLIRLPLLLWLISFQALINLGNWLICPNI